MSQPKWEMKANTKKILRLVPEEGLLKKLVLAALENEYYRGRNEGLRRKENHEAR